MPANVTGDPLGITAVFSDGSRAGFTFTGTPCPRLAGDLLTALAVMVHPHGELDAADSVKLYCAAIRNMTGALAGAEAGGFAGGVGDLARGQVARYWMSAPAWAEGAPAGWCWPAARRAWCWPAGWLSWPAGVRSMRAAPGRWSPMARPSGARSPGRA